MPELPKQNVKASFHAITNVKCKPVPSGNKHIHIDSALGKDFIRAYFGSS